MKFGCGINLSCAKYWMNEEKKRKNPTLAIILSAIFPGLGQIYVNQYPKGIVIICLNLIINFLLINPLKLIIEGGGSVQDNSTLIIIAGYTLAGIVLLFYAIFDSKKVAEKINRELGDTN